MAELRKDYILNNWVIIASERALRPHDFKNEEIKIKNKLCHFCPGNENLTPKELMKIPAEGPWKVRVIENKFPAVKLEGNYNIQTHNDFYTFSDAYGSHEVVVETPDKNKQLWDLSHEDLKEIISVYKSRINILSKIEGIKYVQVFKNHGKAAGTSIMHSHSQILSSSKVPENICNEIKNSIINNKCVYCSIIQKEKDSYRKCFANNSFTAFCPYASRFPFEIWIFSNNHLNSLDECNIEDLSLIMKQILLKLKEINAPYNFIIHYSPTKEDNLHFHIEFIPRLSTWAGFEYSGTIINTMPPEEAAKFYRGEK